MSATDTRAAAVPTRPAEPPARPATALLLGLVATVVHLAGAWRVALWTDEVATVSAATRPWSTLGDLLSHVDAVHGAHSALLHVWTSVLGTSPLALRAPSALATGAAVAGVYVLTCRLADRRTALVAAVVAIVTPRLAWSGIEARSFALAAALAVWATWALLTATRRPTAAGWVGYGLLAAGGVFVNVYGALVVVAHLVTLLVLRPPRAVLAGWAAAALGAGAVTAPFALVVMGQGGQLGDSDTALGTVVRNVAVNQWFLGETPTPVGTSTPLLPRDDVLAGLWAPAAVLLAGVCWLLVAVGAASVLRRRDPAGAWVLPWLVLPTAAIVAYAVVSGAGYAPRYATASAPALAIAVALGLRALRGGTGGVVPAVPAAVAPAALSADGTSTTRTTAPSGTAGSSGAAGPSATPRVARPGRGRRETVALVCVVVLALPVLAAQRRPDAKNGSDWDEVAATVEAHARPQDVVYFPVRPEPGTTQRSLRAVRLGYPEQFGDLVDVTLTVSPAGSGTLWGTSAPLDRSLDRLDGARAVWLVTRDDHPAEELAADLATLAGAGFTVVVDHSTARTTILELERA